MTGMDRGRWAMLPASVIIIEGYTHACPSNMLKSCVRMEPELTRAKKAR